VGNAHLPCRMALTEISRMAPPLRRRRQHNRALTLTATARRGLKAFAEPIGAPETPPKAHWVREGDGLASAESPAPAVPTLLQR